MDLNMFVFELTPKKDTLESLNNDIFELEKNYQLILKMGLSQETVDIVYNELVSKKKAIKIRMHAVITAM